MNILIPAVEQFFPLDGKNIVKQYYDDPKNIIVDLVQRVPFIMKNGDDLYFVTSSLLDPIPDNCSYALLTSRKPSFKDFNSNSLNFRMWLRHPNFINPTPNEVLESWQDNFKFIKEDNTKNIMGLRPPQMGALYSILAHLQNPNDVGVVVMPTGTGKTETMLSVMVAHRCSKLLIIVPSDALRTQLSNKFSTLGLLREFGIINSECINPIVGVLNEKFEDDDSLLGFLNKVNVVVATMNLLTESSVSQQAILAEKFSQVFVDEAHHSEARTWKRFLSKFDASKIFLFTATPFRNDGKKLKGKFIFNFSLKDAQSQNYYKEIQFLPIREYDKVAADKKIADKAVSQLRDDLANGFDHIIMARCKSKSRAIEVYEYYKEQYDLNPVVIFNNVKDLKSKMASVKAKEHRVIVCVNMLGEGFDLPELKIAAIHDERQSLAITLQFIGRFTRTSFDTLGKASFITNIAYPPIQEEVNHLYARDADWNLLLPIMSQGATDKEINFQEFLDGFKDIDNAVIPFQSINPAMSTVVYRNTKSNWSPNNWRSGISNIDSYAHQYSRHNPENNTLVIILGKISRVEWVNFDSIQNMEWNMIVIHWIYEPNRNLVFVHSSMKGGATLKLSQSVFGNNLDLIRGMDVFKIFHEVKRLTLYNVGARKGIGQDISFQSFFGKGVQDGIKLLEQGTLIKNNVFGVGYRNGERISLGCSVKGKIWSYLRGNLNELVIWFDMIGSLLINPNINPNVLLENTLIPVSINSKPNVMPIAVEWNPFMYKFPENRFIINVNGAEYDLSNSELAVADSQNNEPLRFDFIAENLNIRFELKLGTKNVEATEVNYYEVVKLSAEEPIITFGNHTMTLTEFFQEFTPIFWFANGGQLLKDKYVIPKENAGLIALDDIISEDWTGVSINKEAQGIYPYVQDSIQFHFINKIKDDFQIIYDDDGSGEIADVIGVNDQEKRIDIHLFHLKYAKGGNTGNDIGNFYEVCGQAQKSLNWKYRDGRDFFNHLLRRQIKLKAGQSCSRIIKGTEHDLELLLSAAKWTKELKFHVYIVQPSLIKDNASEAILLLLGSTQHYLHTVGDVNLKVYSS